MSNLTGFLKDELWLHGADLVGVGSLTELPEDVRAGLPIGIAIAVKFPKAVIRGIADKPASQLCCLTTITSCCMTVSIFELSHPLLPRITSLKVRRLCLMLSAKQLTRSLEPSSRRLRNTALKRSCS